MNSEKDNENEDEDDKEFWIKDLKGQIERLATQEIVKYTGKFIPKFLKGTRYGDQIAVFGNKIQKNLENTNIFMVGTGALGC